MTLTKNTRRLLALVALLLLCSMCSSALAYAGGYPYYPCYPYDPYYSYGPSYWYGTGGYRYNYYNASPRTGSYNGCGELKFVVREESAAHLRGVWVNGAELVEGRHYTASTVQLDQTLIVFHESFLQSLGKGVNNMRIRFDNGEVSSYIHVNYAPGAYYGDDLYHYNPDYIRPVAPPSKYTTSGTGNAVTLRSVTVYEEPSSKSDKLGSYDSGTSVYVTGFTTSGTYAIIRFGSETGYIRAEHLRVEFTGGYTGETSTKAYLYTERSTSSKYRFAELEKGVSLTLLARYGSYWKVDFGGDILYIQAKNVKSIAAW